VPPIRSSPFAAATQTGATPWPAVGWAALAVAFLCAGVVLWDVLLRGYRQHMVIMNWVWPLTALYWGPVAVYFHFGRARRMSHRWAQARGLHPEQTISSEDEEPSRYRPFARKNWWAISKGVGHCGAGCTLGTSPGSGSCTRHR
jgi:hypothetical protein